MSLLHGYFTLAQRTTLLAAAVISVLIFPKISSVVAATPSEEAYVITRHDTYLGKSIGYMGSTGVKVVFPEYKILFVAKAPTWKVILYNEVNKVAFETPWDFWVNHGFRKAGDLRFMMKGETKKSFDRGLKLNVITVRHVANEPSGPRLQGFYQGGNKDVNIKIKELTYTTEVPLSARARDFIHGLIRTPVEMVLPLSYSWFDETGRRLPVFSTDSIEKTMINPSIFDYPKTYKVTTNDDDVFMGGVRKGEVEGVLDDLLGGDDKGTTNGATKSPKKPK